MDQSYHCADSFAIYRLPVCRLQSGAELAFRRLSLPPLRACELADDNADGVPDLFQQGAVRGVWDKKRVLIFHISTLYPVSV